MAECIFQNVYSKHLPFWESLSNEEKEHLCRSSLKVNYKKGENVHDSTVCSGVFFIRSGCLRVYIMSEDGKSITLYRLHSGDMCMLSASCVLQSITFDVFVDAEDDSECFVINGPAYASLSERNPEVKIFSLETALGRFSDVMWVIQQVLFMSMDKRLCIFLSDESSRLGSDIIPLTHEQIAKYMGTAREVVTRTLKYLSNEGIVELLRGGIKITDRKKLRSLTV